MQQAKGRIERLFKTFQDRLIKEMRLRGIKTKEEANKFLEEYLPIYDKRFSVEPAKKINLHRAVPEGANLDDVLCRLTVRVLRNDFTVSHDNKLYQVENRTRAKKVILCEPKADNFKKLIYVELMNDYISKDCTTASRAIPLILVARHLERICDHSTNIAEDVIYMVQAKVVKHHPKNLVI